LASYGYVVAAPPHPGNTIFDGIPACAANAALVASFQERPNDIIFVTDQLLAATADSSSPFFGGIDPQRIGMSGHSFGGLTTYLVTQLDARYRVAVLLAPAVPGMPTVTVPSLSMFGQVDTYLDPLDRIRNAYLRSSSPKLKVEIAHAGHFAFSDGCFPSPDATRRRR